LSELLATRNALLSVGYRQMTMLAHTGYARDLLEVSEKVRSSVSKAPYPSSTYCNQLGITPPQTLA
jgi:hypothetical protein